MVTKMGNVKLKPMKSIYFDNMNLYNTQKMMFMSWK